MSAHKRMYDSSSLAAHRRRSSKNQAQGMVEMVVAAYLLETKTYPIYTHILKTKIDWAPNPRL